MSKCIHNSNARFDLRYPRKNAIKLESYLCICINLKIALEIPTTTIVQLASRSSLAKKKINIKGEIIDTKYIKNIITILQNDSEKEYIIELNKKIAQIIFLLLVKIAQLVPVETREELGIITRKKNEFGFINRIEISVNMAEKKYLAIIERKIKDQPQIFEAEVIICKSGKIGIINLYIPAKSSKHIKIFIYNTTKEILKIPKETIIEYLCIEVEDQLPNTIPDFLQLCGYVDITSQTIYE
ncbi:hypothetical protein G9A89_012499 [Geosiphon pyriformis]|nr:hypothetical protein G9A89_012499 [Geosiphon pyriformis]